MSDESTQPQDAPLEQWAPDQYPPRDADPQRGPAEPEDVNLETPKDQTPNEQVAAESHFDEHAPESEADAPDPGSDGGSEIARKVMTQARFPSHEPAVDQAANMEGDKLPPQPIKVDGRTRRSDKDGLEGHLVDIVEGVHAGLSGSFDRVLQYARDGYPKQIIVKTRDAESELLSVAYDHVRPSRRAGGR